MEMRELPISTFARYFEASDQQKLRIVDQTFSSGMDYYWALRNTLAETHWRSDDIGTFEAALDGLLGSVKSATQREHYRKLAQGYIDFWQRYPGAHVFSVPTGHTEINGLPIRVNTDIGMAYGNDFFAIKLFLRAAPPTTKYRQAVQHVTALATRHEWNPNWQATLLDVRRGLLLHAMPLPWKFDLAVGAQAAAYRHTWEQMREEAEQRRMER